MPENVRMPRLMIAGLHGGYFLDIAEWVLEMFSELPENPKPAKASAYLSLLQMTTPTTSIRPLLTAEIGNSLPLDSMKCYELCQEKSYRMEERAFSDGHISGYQSRDISRGRWGGAIRGTEINGTTLIGAISGLSGDHSDEAVILVIFLFCHWITFDDAKKIAAISQNPFFIPLLNACNGCKITGFKSIADPTNEPVARPRKRITSPTTEFHAPVKTTDPDPSA